MKWFDEWDKNVLQISWWLKRLLVVVVIYTFRWHVLEKNGLSGCSSPSPQTETLHPPLLRSNRPFISTQRLGVENKTSWWQLFGEKLWKKAYISPTSMKTIHLDRNKMGGFCACVCAGHPSPHPSSLLACCSSLHHHLSSNRGPSGLKGALNSGQRPKGMAHSVRHLKDGSRTGSSKKNPSLSSKTGGEGDEGL